MSGIPVPVEARLRYLQRRQDEIAKMKTSFGTAPDWEFIAKIGHQIKGNAITFGFPSLTAFGRDLEELAKAQNLQGLQNRVEELEEETVLLLARLGRAP